MRWCLWFCFFVFFLLFCHRTVSCLQPTKLSTNRNWEDHVLRKAFNFKSLFLYRWQEKISVTQFESEYLTFVVDMALHYLMYTQYLTAQWFKTLAKGKCEEDVGSKPWIPFVESEIFWLSIKNPCFICWFVWVGVLDHVVGGQDCASNILSWLQRYFLIFLALLYNSKIIWLLHFIHYISSWVEPVCKILCFAEYLSSCYLVGIIIVLTSML